MSSRDDGYSRVYHSAPNDPKFAAVWPDDRRLATWLRLLRLAEIAYPHPAPVPRGTHPPSLAHLVAVGIIEQHPGDRFTVHGLEAERERREKRGVAGGLARARKAPRHSTGRFATSVHDGPALAGYAGPATLVQRTSEDEDEDEDERVRTPLLTSREKPGGAEDPTEDDEGMAFQ